MRVSLLYLFVNHIWSVNNEEKEKNVQNKFYIEHGYVSSNPIWM